MKKFLSFVCRRPIACISLCLLILLYLMMIFAEFIAPYEPTTSFENKSYHPPNVRFYDYGLKAQEARVINTVSQALSSTPSLISILKISSVQ